MESRASHALVGLFALALLATLGGVVFWFGSGGGAGKTDARLVFNDRVSGLGRGSSVLFNGLRVGEVTQIALHPDNPRQIYAVIRVDQSTPLRVDTRARTEALGLAGVVAVQLLGGEPHAAVLTAQAGQDLPTITAESSDGLLETVRTVAKRTEDALGGIEAMVKQNAGPIAEGIRAVEAFSASLSDSADGVAKLMQGIGSVADVVAPVTTKLGAFSEDMAGTIRAINREQIVATVEDASRLAATLGGASGEVGKALKDTASISDKLNRVADQTESVLKGAQEFMNTAVGVDGRNAFSDVADAARDLRVLSENLDKSSAGITAEIVRFTAAGLRGIEPFVNSGRRALTGFGRTLQRIEQDPQQLIFGSKPTLPPYSGSR